jgi:hypothetical protein
MLVYFCSLVASTYHRCRLTPSKHLLRPFLCVYSIIADDLIPPLTSTTSSPTINPTRTCVETIRIARFNQSRRLIDDYASSTPVLRLESLDINLDLLLVIHSVAVRRIERKKISYPHFVKARVECIASAAGHLKLSTSGGIKV